MKKFRYIAAAAGLTVAVAAYAAEETVTKTEQSVTRSADGTQVKKTTTTSVTTYVDRLRTVYTTAGIQEAKIARLIEIDRQIFEAHQAGDWVTVRRLRIEQRALLSPEEVTKVYTYFQSNPLPAEFAPIATYTYIPQEQFQTHIISNQSGRIDVGAISVPGVSASSIRTGSATSSGDPAVRVGTSEVRSGGSTGVSGSTGTNPTLGTSEVRSGTSSGSNPTLGTSAVRSGTSSSSSDPDTKATPSSGSGTSKPGATTYSPGSTSNATASGSSGTGSSSTPGASTGTGTGTGSSMSSTGSTGSPTSTPSSTSGSSMGTSSGTGSGAAPRTGSGTGTVGTSSGTSGGSSSSSGAGSSSSGAGTSTMGSTGAGNASTAGSTGSPTGNTASGSTGSGTTGSNAN